MGFLQSHSHDQKTCVLEGNFLNWFFCLTSFGEVLNLTPIAVPETRRLDGAKTVHDTTKENRVILLSPGIFCVVGTDILLSPQLFCVVNTLVKGRVSSN